MGQEYTKGECAFIGCGATAKFIFETLESAADRGYGVIVEPVGTEDRRAFNLYQVTPAKAKIAPCLCEAFEELILKDKFGSIRLPTLARDMMVKAVGKGGG